MKQIKKAGTKQFFISLFLIFITIVFFRYIRFIMPSYGVIADILCLIVMCVLGFKVLVHYCAVYTYTCRDKKLKLNRTIGKRNKETEILLSSIISISDKKPETKYIFKYNPNILKNKNSKYIVFKKDKVLQAVLVEADNELMEFLKEFTKGNN